MQTAEKVLHAVEVHLAENEWGNELMRDVALATFADPKYADIDELIVTVYEHAGWWLSYARTRGGILVVSSANDSAVFHGPAWQWRREHKEHHWKYIDDVRRPRAPEKEEV